MVIKLVFLQVARLTGTKIADKVQVKGPPNIVYLSFQDLCRLESTTSITLFHLQLSLVCVWIRELLFRVLDKLPACTRYW